MRKQEQYEVFNVPFAATAIEFCWRWLFHNYIKFYYIFEEWQFFQALTTHLWENGEWYDSYRHLIFQYIEKFKNGENHLKRLFIVGLCNITQMLFNLLDTWSLTTTCRSFHKNFPTYWSQVTFRGNIVSFLMLYSGISNIQNHFSSTEIVLLIHTCQKIGLMALLEILLHCHSLHVPYLSQDQNCFCLAAALALKYLIHFNFWQISYKMQTIHYNLDLLTPFFWHANIKLYCTFLLNELNNFATNK